MKKKNPYTDQYSQAIKNLEEKKELLPLHKMDDASRRKFIQSVGYFLGALSVPSIIRLETMSDLSRRIFGNSMAYAAGFASGPIDINIYLRAGFSTRWIVGYNGDDTALSTSATVPWATGVTATPVGGGPNVILPPNAQGLVPFAGAIQQVLGKSSGGHTAYFQHTQKQGMGELLSWRAATESEAGGSTLLKTPFGFGSTTNVAVTDLPGTLAEFSPQMFNSIADAYSQFSPPTLKTNKGTTLTASLRNQLLAVIGSRFKEKIEAGVLQKNSALITSANEQSLKILATDYQAELNPASPANTAVMAALTSGLGSQGNLSIGGINPAQAIFVLIKAALLGITPMVGGLVGTTTDWHAFNAVPSGDGTGDLRFTTGKFLADLIKNVCTAASGGMFVNAVNGTPQEIRIHVFSEFARTLGLGNNLSDNGDGQVCATLTIGSKSSQKDYKHGCYGGSNTSNAEVGFNPSTGAHSASIPWVTPDTMLGHSLNLLKIDKTKLGLTGFPGFSGDLA